MVCVINITHDKSIQKEYLLKNSSLVYCIAMLLKNSIEA